MIFTQEGYDPGDDPTGVPLIGYDNQISDITATSEASGFPVSNLLNSATHLVWKSEDTSAQTLGITVASEANYLAIAGHNLGSTSRRLALLQSDNVDAVQGFLTLLMHFEGTNGGVDFVDTSGNDLLWGTVNTGTLTNAQFKFGAMSVSFAGTGYIYTGGDRFAFGASDFTIDFWLRINATGTTYTLWDTDGDSTGIRITKSSADVLVYRTGGVNQITGATALTTGQWYHVAVTRSGTNTKMFLDGAQQGSTYVDSNSYGAADLARIGMDVTNANGLNGWIDELRVLTGTADWTSTFSPPSVAYADGLETLFGNYSVYLAFNGTDASTTITDTSGSDHTWTANGNAQIDTAQSRFGGASCLFDGTGDYIAGDGSDEFAFGTGDFTIDFWMRPTTSTQQTLYDSRPFGLDGLYVRIYKKSNDHIIFAVNGIDQIDSGVAHTLNQWAHIAITRASGSTKLFVDGVQHGSTYSDSNNYLNGTSGPIIGINAFTLNTEGWNGWIDELRIVKGTALWTARFVAPNHALISSATLGRYIDIEDDLPVIFRFSDAAFLSLQIASGSEAAQMAVVYAGELLVLERSIKMDAQHRNVTHARRSSILAGMSESGNFLGRVLLAEWRESQAEFAWFTPDWYRTYFEPFVQSALTEPFFWAWNPNEYPEETAYAWIIEDIVPETDPATRRIAVTISMRAIA